MHPLPRSSLTNSTKVKVKVIFLPTVSRPVCLAVRHPSGIRDQFFCFLLQLFSDRWEGGSVVFRRCWTRQCSLSRAWVPRDSWPYFTVSIFEALPTWRARLLHLLSQEHPSSLSHLLRFCRYCICTDVEENSASHNSSVVVCTHVSKPSARGYNWATLFLGDINTGTWPFRSGESQMRQKIMRWVLGDLVTRMLDLERPRTYPLVREGAP
jgi:hypothetical protein